jgi:glycosyltransferase involved in cell wall biosynthesis
MVPEQRSARPRLTIVTPVFNEAGNLETFVTRVSQVLFSREDFDACVLFVDDGSSDASWSMIQDIVARSDRFSALRLSRNFGAHCALAAGFDHVNADAEIVATLACDLQDPPETVIEFIAQWRQGANVVWGARRGREDAGWRMLGSRSLMTLLRRYSMPKGSKFQTGSFFLIDQVVLESLIRMREHSRVTFALVGWMGFEQAVVSYDRPARQNGQSGWTFSKMLSTSYDLLIGFSPVPAKVLTMLGFILFGLSLTVIFYLFLTWLLQDVQPGWTGLMATMTLCFGMLFMMLGVMSEYLHRIFIEAKGRPLYFIARRVGEVGMRELRRD